MVVERDGAARMIPVDVLGQDGLHTGIATDALKAGDLVMTKGHVRLRPGQAVQAAS